MASYGSLATQPARIGEEANREGFRNLGTLLDNVIDIYDPATGQLLVSTTFDIQNTMLERFLSDSTVVGHQTNPVVDKAVIYRFEVRGPVPRPN